MSAMLESRFPGPAPSLRALMSTGGWLAIAVVAVVAAAYYDTMASMVAVWMSSGTFMHGFIIIPMACYLIWIQRDRLVGLAPQPWLPGLYLLAVLGLIWLLATLAGVQVARQYSAVAMIPASVLTVLGARMAGKIAFPLAFLLLAVPFGDAYIPALIDFTADSLVLALRITGIPVYREANSFSIPTGSWSVVEACSGLRYLIASITLGFLYAYLTYRSLLRRAAFIALSVIIPILANSARAYMIVMIGHLSSMKYAVGIDHLIYGWLFFGLVMMLLFWIGAKWREDGDVKPAIVAATGPGNVYRPKLVAFSALMSVAVAIVWPLWAHIAFVPSANASPSKIELPERVDAWQRHDADFVWKPEYVGTPAITQATYRRADREISVSVAFYPEQRPDAGLVAYGNTLVKEDNKRWHGFQESEKTVDNGADPFTLRQAQIYGREANVLVWRWYAMDGATMVNPAFVKARVALNRLLGRGSGGAEVTLAATFDDNKDSVSTDLQDFLRSAMPAIMEGVDHARRH